MTDTDKITTAPKPPRPEAINMRVEARVAAIKALYSNDVNDEKKTPLVLALDLLSLYETSEYENETKPHSGFLKELLVGVAEHQTMLDEKIAAHLQAGWKMERLGVVMCSLLRVSVYELMAYEKLPVKVIINEYVNIAREFFDEKDVKFVNGVLDKIAKEVRI